MMLFGALEAGGTKMVCSVLDENGNMLERVSLPTLTPAETMPALIDFFKSKQIDALGVASFGPVDLNPASPTWGYITSTPKLAWRDYPLTPELKDALNVPVGLDTDCNAAALSEWQLGAARGLQSCVYVTVGTGIGAGLVVEGNLVHGLVHSELGHILLKALPQDPSPLGFCPYHKSCLEGLANGPAIQQRWGKPAQDLPPEHPAWALEAEYLAQMCWNTLVTLSPEKIILGGGVMQQSHLFPMIRERVKAISGDYVRHPMTETFADYIVPPGLGTNSGVMGAYLLAKKAWEDAQ